MSALQKVTIVGNLTADPELRFTPSGAAVTNFSVAVTPRRKNQQTQEWEDGEASFYRVAAWRGLAENVAESLTRGTRVIVMGDLSVRKYDNKDGGQGTSVDINADFIGPDLTFATAQVTKANRGGNGGNRGGNGGGGFGGGNQPANDPWAGGGEEPPF